MVMKKLSAQHHATKPREGVAHKLVNDRFSNPKVAAIKHCTKRTCRGRISRELNEENSQPLGISLNGQQKTVEYLVDVTA
ncbi:hypothetical protein Zmor_007693 [Zophobas morio]|uniref:Uncharacterized protein n=1 Tax=Zophobas morio TaxID=2755281 RepID=A0AA38IW68_9CUCU|nr:hypothetical protein Zmor_007693 [Zophobas morio]